MKRIYIAGPMTGIPAFNFPAFNRAAHILRALGYDVVNPAELDAGDVGPDGKATKPYTWYLRRDLRALLDCNAVALLHGWEDSTGATLEAHVAKALGMDVRELGDILPEADAA